MNNNYEIITREAYRNKKRAESYQSQFDGIFSWARIAMNRELEITKRVIDHYSVSEKDIILDAPCGTGIAGLMLSKLPSKVIATDISNEMMEYAIDSYSADQFMGFLQADVASLPLSDRAVVGVIVLGFMHRVPVEIKLLTLRELTRVTSNFIVVSITVDSFLYRAKKLVRRLLGKENRAAPEPLDYDSIVDIVNKEGLQIRGITKVVPLFSSEIILWLEKNN